MSRSPQSDRVVALFDDGSVLTARDVADELGWKVQLSSAHLHRLWARGQLQRRGQHGGEVGYLYERRTAR